MKNKICCLALLLFFSPVLVAAAQDSALESPYDLLKKDVGNWDVKIKMWMGPGDPEQTAGTETVKMIGDYWQVSDFQGEMMGAQFSGHSVTGYDEKTKQYVGTWVDSMNPNPTKMVGHYDPATKTATYEGTGLDPSGNPMNSRMVVVYRDDGTHTFTMSAPNQAGNGEWVKVMEMIYSKK